MSSGQSPEFLLLPVRHFIPCSFGGDPLRSFHLSAMRLQAGPAGARETSPHLRLRRVSLGEDRPVVLEKPFRGQRSTVAPLPQPFCIVPAQHFSLPRGGVPGMPWVPSGIRPLRLPTRASNTQGRARFPLSGDESEVPRHRAFTDTPNLRDGWQPGLAVA